MYQPAAAASDAAAVVQRAAVRRPPRRDLPLPLSFPVARHSTPMAQEEGVPRASATVETEGEIEGEGERVRG